MRKPVMFGCALSALALVVGCGGGGEDAAIKESIGILNEMAGVMEKVTDAKSLQDAQTKLKSYESRMKELGEKMKGVSKARDAELQKKYEPELKAATERLMKATMAAAMKGAGGGLFPKDFKIPTP